jgi:TonB family protein
MKRFLALVIFLAGVVFAPSANAQQLPTAVQDRLDRARFAITRQQYDEAIGELRSALKISNACVDCYFQLLRAYQLVGAHKDALDTARKALEIAPNDRLRSAAHDAIGAEISELAKTGKMRHEDAEHEFRTAVQLDPGNGTANFNLGVELMRENRDADGVAVLKEYLARAPGDSNAKDAIAFIDNPRRAREDFAPADFAVVTTNGEYVTLEDVKGKVVLLDFWASWCAPCVSALPTLRGLSKRYSKDQFTLISISVDQNEQAWRNFMTKHQMDWSQALDRQAKLSRMFNVKPIPTYVLIDAEGVMRSYVIGASIASAAQLNDEVKKYVKIAPKVVQTAAPNVPASAPSSTIVPATSSAASSVPAIVPAPDAALRAASLPGMSATSGGSSAPVAAVPGRIQNIPPEEMWRRVAQCVLPAYPASALSARITGTVNVGLGITPQGDVGNGSRVMAGPPELVRPAMDALRQWRFRPNVVQGQVTFSRLRALVRFNADGTTAIDFAPANLPDNFGDPGTPPAAPAAFPRPRPADAVACTGGSDAGSNAPAATPGPTAESVGGAPVQAGVGGVGRPVCISCPQPEFSQAARDAKTGGIVVLRVIITAEGRATNIQVVNGPGKGLGLEENAIAAVRTWRFRPAMDPSGTPVAVVTLLEVKFDLF